MFQRLVFCMALFAGLSARAQTINLHGKVTNSAGQGISGAVVTLVGQNLKDTTDANGAYAITHSSDAVSPGLVLHNENVVINRGMLELHLDAPAPVKIEVFDVSSNLIKEETFAKAPAGEFRWNINGDFGAANLLLVRATIGGRVSTFRYFPLSSGRYSAKSSAEPTFQGKALAKTMAGAAVDSLQFKANGYGTKVVQVSSYVDSVNVTLGTGDRWGGLKNPPIKSAGCGKALGSINKSGTYHITSGSRGDYIIDIPTSYNKDTTYRIIFGMHCLGGSAARVAAPDNGDDLSGFYSMKTLATKDNIQCIYVAPQGNSDGTWAPATDPKFFADILDTLEDNLCIDTTRVFVTGFSFGAMFSYDLSLGYPERIRAVAAYAPANFHFDPEPTNRHIPIAYYQTTGINDGTCPWISSDAQKTGGKYCLRQHAEDNGCTNADVDVKLATNGAHVTTEFTGCNAGYPVKFGSFVGGHQAVASDPGSSDNWIQNEAWDFLKRF